MDQIQWNQLAPKIARGGGMLPWPGGADKDQRAGIDANRLSLIVTQGIQWPKAETLHLRVSTRQEIIYLSIIVIFASKGMFLKGTDDRFLLSQDEQLTPDIDEVVVIYVFWKRPLNRRFYVNF